MNSQQQQYNTFCKCQMRFQHQISHICLNETCNSQPQQRYICHNCKQAHSNTCDQQKIVDIPYFLSQLRGISQINPQQLTYLKNHYSQITTILTNINQIKQANTVTQNDIQAINEICYFFEYNPETKKFKHDFINMCQKKQEQHKQQLQQQQEEEEEEPPKQNSLNNKISSSNSLPKFVYNPIHVKEEEPYTPQPHLPLPPPPPPPTYNPKLNVPLTQDTIKQEHFETKYNPIKPIQKQYQQQNQQQVQQNQKTNQPQSQSQLPKNNINNLAIEQNNNQQIQQQQFDSLHSLLPQNQQLPQSNQPKQTNSTITTNNKNTTNTIVKNTNKTSHEKNTTKNQEKSTQQKPTEQKEKTPTTKNTNKKEEKLLEKYTAKKETQSQLHQEKENQSLSQSPEPLTKSLNNSNKNLTKEQEELEIVKQFAIKGVLKDVHESYSHYSKDAIKQLRNKYKNHLEISELIYKNNTYTKREKEQIGYEIYCYKDQDKKYQISQKKWNLPQKDIDIILQNNHKNYKQYKQQNLTTLFKNDPILSYRILLRNIKKQEENPDHQDTHKIVKKIKTEDLPFSKQTSIQSNISDLKTPITTPFIINQKSQQQQQKFDFSQQQQQQQNQQQQQQQQNELLSQLKKQIEIQQKQIEQLETQKSQQNIKNEHIQQIVQKTLKTQQLHQKQQKLKINNLQPIQIHHQKPKKTLTFNSKIFDLQVQKHSQSHIVLTKKQLVQIMKQFHMKFPVYLPKVELYTFVQGYDEHIYTIQSQFSQIHTCGSCFKNDTPIEIKPKIQEQYVEHINLFTTGYQQANILATYFKNIIQQNQKQGKFMEFNTQYIPMYKGYPILQIHAKKIVKKSLFYNLLEQVYIKINKNDPIPFSEFMGNIPDFINTLDDLQQNQQQQQKQQQIQNKN